MQFLFTAKPVSAPIVTFAGSKGGRIPVQKAKEINQLVIDDEWDITGYAVYITGGNLESPVFKTVRGEGKFTEEVQRLISNCSPGTTLTVDEIRVKMKKADFERPCAGDFYKC
jgi:hypothetical protein